MLAWLVLRSSTDGDTNEPSVISVMLSSNDRPVAIPMMSPVSDSTTDSSRPAPVSG